MAYTIRHDGNEFTRVSYIDEMSIQDLTREFNQTQSNLDEALSMAQGLGMVCERN